MLVLGIETSCDETAAALVADGKMVLSNVIATQFDLLKKYGGVVPEIAARRHTELIGYIVEEALDTAGKTLDDVDAVADQIDGHGDLLAEGAFDLGHGEGDRVARAVFFRRRIDGGSPIGRDD